MSMINLKTRILQKKERNPTRQALSDDEGIMYIKDGGYEIDLVGGGIGTIAAGSGSGATPVTTFAKVQAEIKNAGSETVYFNSEAVTGTSDGYPILPGEVINIKREANLYFWSAATTTLHYAILK